MRKDFKSWLMGLATTLSAAGALQTPDQFIGFRVGADNQLARWDKIVDYMKLAASNSDRVRFRELGKTSNNNPFVALEISSPDISMPASSTDSRRATASSDSPS